MNRYFKIVFTDAQGRSEVLSSPNEIWRDDAMRNPVTRNVFQQTTDDGDDFGNIRRRVIVSMERNETVITPGSRIEIVKCEFDGDKCK